MTPIDWYVLVFSPAVVVALAAVPLLWARHSLKRDRRAIGDAEGHPGSSWHAAAPK